MRIGKKWIEYILVLCHFGLVSHLGLKFESSAHEVDLIMVLQPCCEYLSIH